MTRIPINDVGSVGIVQSSDNTTHLLPVNAWSNGKNVRFQDNKVMKFLGHTQIFNPPTIAPYWALGVPTNTEMYWLYAGLAKAYVVDQANTHTNLTRVSGGDYSMDPDFNWNGGVLGGIAILNNGVDIPQAWLYPNPLTTKLVNLPNWQSTVRAKVIRPFKEFLIAINITKSGVEYPHMVKWSHPAVPGSVPESWDETDESKDAGEKNLTDVQSGVFRDLLQLRDIMVLYKEGSVHGMQFIGGSDIFRLYNILENTGILAGNCVAALPTGSGQQIQGHFLATGDDLVILDGQGARSIIDRRWRKYITDNISQTHFGKSFCVSNNAMKEMWFCFPEGDSIRPNRVITYSLVDQSIGTRELSNISYIATGALALDAMTDDWSSSEPWDSDVATWGSQTFAPFVNRLIATDPTATKLYRMDSSTQFNGVNMESFVERQGIAVIGVSRTGVPILDFSKRKMVTRMWPRMTGGPVNIYIGSQETSEAPIIYSNAIQFTPGVDEHVDPDPPPNGRLISVKIESLGSAHWELNGYDLNVEDLGEN